MNIKNKKIVLIANGEFPKHPIPKKIINNAEIIVCCDGAANDTIGNGYTPNIIIGDFDSIDKNQTKLKNIKLIKLSDQNENDLRKSLYWIEKNNVKDVIILGATGKREDHSIANIFSICQININLNMKIVTDYGIFILIENKMNVKTFINQKISFFSVSNKTKITANGLKYPLKNKQFTTLYDGALNIAVKDNIELFVENGKAVMYLVHKDIDND